jgi:hypothetical protein
MAVNKAGVSPNRVHVMAMFMATPPGKRVMRPGTSDPWRIAKGARPITSHRTDPMHTMSADLLMAAFLPGSRARGKGVCALA